jgi:hypothetical protein
MGRRVGRFRRKRTSRTPGRSSPKQKTKESRMAWDQSRLRPPLSGPRLADGLDKLGTCDKSFLFDSAGFWPIARVVGPRETIRQTNRAPNGLRPGRPGRRLVHRTNIAQNCLGCDNQMCIRRREHGLYILAFKLSQERDIKTPTNAESQSLVQVPLT